MSSRLFKEDVKFYQRFLKSNGFLNGSLDGIWGQKTDAADKKFFENSIQIRDESGSFDVRSEENILTLAPKAQKTARKFLKILRTDHNLDVRIISGTRTYAQQDMLYSIGRTLQKNKSPVTNAKGGQSNHNFGLAWDIGIFEKGKYITADSTYKKLDPLVRGKIDNLLWGGDWKNFKDFPHYEHRPKFSKLSEIRKAFESGKPYL